MSSTDSRCCCSLRHTGNTDDVEKEGYKRRTPLMLAACDGHFECLEFLLAPGVIGNININRGDEDGSTALMLAAEHGHVDVVNCLLDTGLVDVNRRNSERLTAFMLAAKNGHVTCVECFLERGLVDDINAGDRLGSTALMFAAENGHDSCVACLLGSGLLVDVNRTCLDVNETTALMLAARDGHVACVRLLLDTGLVNVVKAGQTRSTALMLASQNGRVECVKALLEKGVEDPNVVNFVGLTALMLAAMEGHSECVKCLLDSGLLKDVCKEGMFGKNALMLAAEKGNLECVRYLVASEMVDVNMVSEATGETALIIAASHGHTECVKCLLDTGLIVDTDETNYNVSAAFRCAVVTGNLECAEYLLETRLVKHVDREDNNGATTFMQAADRGHSRCLKYFLETGLVDDINKEDTNWKTAFMMAASSSDVECIKCLLDTGLVHDINKEDKSGRTALMEAAEHGRAENIKYLLDTGLIDDLNKRDSSGKTAFELAAAEGHADCLRCFFDISVVDETPSSDDAQKFSSASLFTPNDLMTCFTYAPGITWKSPYVYDRDQQGQSILKLVVGRGLGRCVVCLLLGNLDVPLKPHSVCDHRGLELEHPAALDVRRGDPKIKPLGTNRLVEEDYVDYMLQFERIRFHTLVHLLGEEYARTSQISLVLYSKLCSLIWDPDDVDYLLRMMCAGLHPGKCVDFLLSAFIWQIDRTGYSALGVAGGCLRYESQCLGKLLQHIFVEDSHPLPESCREVFVSLSWSRMPGQSRGFNERLNLFLGNGVFCWSWYHEFQESRLRHLARALVAHGYSPGGFKWRGKPSSPLHHAFMTGDDGLVRYLVSNLYLTSLDANRFQRDKDLRDHVLRDGSENLQSLYRQIFGTPWRLRVLSFVKVSSLLTCTARREDAAPVGTLPIPEVFKRQLSFADTNRMAEVKDWDSLDVCLV